MHTYIDTNMCINIYYDIWKQLHFMNNCQVTNYFSITKAALLNFHVPLQIKTNKQLSIL